MYCCKPFPCRCMSVAVCLTSLGVVGSRWAPRSSKPAAGRSAGRGGFDSHPLPPGFRGIVSRGV